LLFKTISSPGLFGALAQPDYRVSAKATEATAIKINSIISILVDKVESSATLTLVKVAVTSFVVSVFQVTDKAKNFTNGFKVLVTSNEVAICVITGKVV
jgi:hypothetical protein